jgi:hypothetical protein
MAGCAQLFPTFANAAAARLRRSPRLPAPFPPVPASVRALLPCPRFRPQSSAPAAAGFAAGAAASGGGALAAFNAQFRAAAEAFDAREREQKAARKAAGKAALKKALAERKAAVDARKAKNREEEAATEQAMLDALQGESWSRVVDLVNVHAAGQAGAAAGGAPAAAGGGAASAAAAAGKKGGGASSGAASGDRAGADASRMKDILLGLKAKPLAV